MALGQEVKRHQHAILLAALLALASLSACGKEAAKSAQTGPTVGDLLKALDSRQAGRLDPAALRVMPDADVEQAVIDYVISKLEGKEDHEAEIVAGLPSGVRATWLTWIVEAEVNNGGFNQYYFNTDGQFASDAVAAFEYFGAKEHAALVKEANAVRAAEAAEMAKFKAQGTLEAFSESYKHSRLGPLDDRFYKLTENLSQLRIARIRQKPDEFAGE